jgi:CubicO group peptidase (beta-lactamase class C family)
MRTRRRFCKGLVLFFPIAVVAALVAVSPIEGASPRFPGTHWDHISPEWAGFAPDRLAEFVGLVGGNGILVRYGRVVTWWGWYAHPLDVASGCKPVYAHFVYAAIKDGLIGNLDERVSARVPDLALTGDASDDPNDHITWRHLLQQTSGYGVQERPGMAFNYSDYQAAFLADTLVLGIYRSSYEQADRNILHKVLAGPLAFEDKASLNHHLSLPGRLRISARDWARFGLLYLNKGEWKGRQYIPRNLAIHAVSSPLPHDFPRTDLVEVRMRDNQRSLGGGVDLESHMGSYSYMWWVNGEVGKGRRLFPDLPADAFLAMGHSGHDVLLVIPSLDMVVCWIDAFPGRRHAASFTMEGHQMVNAAMGKLISAVIDP